MEKAKPTTPSTERSLLSPRKIEPKRGQGGYKKKFTKAKPHYYKPQLKGTVVQTGKEITLVGKGSGGAIRKKDEKKSDKGKAVASGVISNPAKTLANRQIKKVAVEKITVASQEKVGWSETIWRFPSTSVKKLSDWGGSVKDLTGTVSGSVKGTFQKAKDYTWANKDFFKKLAFTTITSSWMEMALMQAFQVSTGTFIPAMVIRAANYVVSEILWCAFTNKKVPVEELKRVTKGVAEYPVFSVMVEFALKPFFVNLPVSALVKPLREKGLEGLVSIDVNSYLQYLGENGLLIGKEKAILQATKLVTKKAIVTSFEKVMKPEPKE